jgi:anti-sigma regulatory factor (Ser/Thr protein kinase)
VSAAGREWSHPAGEELAPSVSLELTSLPENLTLVRGMIGGLGDSLGMDPELLDDLKTAVSEAANNVVMHAYGGEAGPMLLDLRVRTDGVEAIVRDEGSGLSELSLVPDAVQGVGLPVIEALSVQAEFTDRPGGGTEVSMLFPARRDGRPLFAVPSAAAPDDGWTRELSGDAVVSLSPVTLLPAVLGRLARALAAGARFSLDRFSDVYLVTDALSAHAGRSASGERIGFSLRAQTRRLELIIGPFREGSTELLHVGESAEVKSPLLLLTDELRAEPAPGGERLHVVMLDHRT